MSKRFLTPVNLPSGANLPLVGRTGDLFFRTTDSSLYVYTGLAWEVSQGGGGGSLDSLTNVTAPTPANNDVLAYSSATSQWVNVTTEVLTGANYDVLEGGNASSTYLVTVNGGSANG